MPTVEELRTLSREIDDLFASGKEEEGLALLEEALEKAKNNPAYLAFFQSEKEHYVNKNYRAQEELLRTALDAAPDDSFLMRTMGVCLSFQDREEEPIQWFDKALESNPKDYHAIRNRGASLSKLDREEEAILWYDKALEVNPKDYRSMRNRGVSLSKLGHEEEAISWYDKALERNPKDYDSMRQRGVSLSKLGREQEALQWYDKALEVNPKDSSAMQQYGVALSKLGREKEALQWFEKALEINPKDFDTMRDRGATLVKLGRSKEALQWLARALEGNPNDYHTMRNYGTILSNLGRQEEALQWLDKALKINPKDYDSMRNRGAVCFKQGRLKDALQWVEKALEIKPNDSEAQFLKAAILNRSSRKDEIKQQEQEIKQFHKQAQQLLQEMEEARHVILGFTATQPDGTEHKEPGLQEKFVAELEQLKKKNAEQQAEFQELQLAYNEKYEKTFKEIEGLLPGATSAGLSKVYRDSKEKHEKKAILWWRLLAGSLIFASIFILISPKILSWLTGLDIVKDDLFSWKIWLYFRLPIAGPLLFFIWKANQKINQHTRLAEEYAHKEAVAMNFEGLRQALPEQIDVQANFFNKAIDVYGHNPSATLDNKNHCRTPANEFCETANAFKDPTK